MDTFQTKSLKITINIQLNINMTVEHIFPTSIYNVKLENVDLIQKEIGSIIDRIPFERSDRLLGHANTLTKSRMDALMEYRLSNTTQSIDFHLKQYLNYLNFEFRPYSIFSWFTRNEPGDYLQIHHHNGVDITGTYYYQTNPDCGDFFFESPTIAATTSLCHSNQHTRKYYTPEVGRLILFPGWINHGVLKNTSDTDRIGISFNISFLR